MNTNQDRQYLEKLEHIDFQPIFILGLHRSGTSILYKMLTTTECFNPVTAYHLIKYNQLIHNHVKKQEESCKKKLTEFFREKGLDDRGIDRLKITADFAEEYGFLLGQKTFEMYLTSKNLQLFIEMCKKIQLISENKKPILLKNPYDFSNFLFIKKAFPNAKFVFIHRHPFKTLSSTIKTIRLLFKERNPYTTQLFRTYNKIFENPLLLQTLRLCFSQLSAFGIIFLSLNTSNATKYYMKNIEKLPKQDYFSITYEDLCKNPQETMEDIMQSLNIKTSKKIDFTSYVKPRKTHLDPSVIQLRNFIFKCMKKYFERFGYKLEGHL